MSGVFQRLGVRTIINAKGPSTRVSGGRMRPEVTAAMAEAAQTCVELSELQAGASAVIAQLTGAEAGYVTSGAAAALLLGTAACLTGLDPARMSRLPDTSGMRDEAVMVRSQRNFYDHAVRAAGARIVEVGLPDRFAGAGVRDAEAWEITAAISERTALVHWVAGPEAVPPLEQVVAVAHARAVPVLVDAAGQLPPAANLRRFIATGADLVAFSGGKAIGGPQASGILCGRRDMVMAAALQHLDLDVEFQHWRPPPALIDKTRLPGLPHHGIGRPCKVGKEQIVGLLTALQTFVAEDPQARRERWSALAQALLRALEGLPGTTVRLLGEGEVPRVALELDQRVTGVGALELMRRLEAGKPAVFADPAQVRRARVLFNPMCLEEGEPARIATRVREVLAGG